jgi:glycosyltransferase involved in cell wall biosynthesis
MDEVVWVTREDQAAVMGAGEQAGGDSRVVPICIEPTRYAPSSRGASRQSHRVTFVGGMHWPPNRDGAVWLAEHIWPGVERAHGDAVLTLVGRSGPQRLARGERIEATGFVEDLDPILGETAVFVVPLRAGAGMRVKILEAWARALPVVSTTLGAEGLGARDGENILLADDAGEFAGAICRLLEDESLRSRIGQGGRRMVEERFDWRREYQAWDEVYPPEGPDRRVGSGTGTEAAHSS